MTRYNITVGVYNTQTIFYVAVRAAVPIYSIHTTYMAIYDELKYPKNTFLR